MPVSVETLQGARHGDMGCGSLGELLRGGAAEVDACKGGQWSRRIWGGREWGVPAWALSLPIWPWTIPSPLRPWCFLSLEFSKAQGSTNQTKTVVWTVILAWWVSLTFLCSVSKNWTPDSTGPPKPVPLQVHEALWLRTSAWVLDRPGFESHIHHLLPQWVTWDMSLLVSDLRVLNHK